MKWIKGLLIVLLVIVVSILSYGFYIKQSVADYKGELTVSCLDARVEIFFDAKGIPQIFAETDRDMYTALGWIHASERLFQMELLRRVGAGRLSEIFGEPLIKYDKRNLQIGFHRIAKRSIDLLEPKAKQFAQSYIDGINAWIQQAKPLPPEFLILRLEPRPWTLHDVLTIGMYQAWFSHALMDKDSRQQWLIDKLGSEAESMLLEYKTWSPPTVPLSPLLSLEMNTLPTYAMARASNSWVLSPTKSTTGHAIHASDPHLAINKIPGLWYIAGLHSKEGTHLLGVTPPGLPFLAMGHNGKIAWSFTVAGLDIIDYFEYPRLAEMEIQGTDGPIPLQKTDYLIPVKDMEPVPYTVLFCEEGVVVRESPDHIRLMKWAGFDQGPHTMVESTFKLHRASQFQEFREIVTNFGALEVNWMYSDHEGNIGYQLGTPIPIRNQKNTFAIHDGSNPEYKWQGYLPLEETPFAYNPNQNWLASCNNQIAGDNWIPLLPGFYDPYRITRISSILDQQKTFSPEQAGSYQFDHQSALALRWKELCAQGAALSGENQVAEDLRKWDGQMSKDSQPAALFQIWWREMTRALFEDQLNDKWLSGGGLKEEVLTKEVTSLIDRTETPDREETKEDISAMAFKKALTVWDRRSWGDICSLSIEHPLAKVDILNQILSLNRGTFSWQGDHASLNATFSSYAYDTGLFKAHDGPSMRYVLDWSDPDAFTINVPMGQSGNPFSPHYDDFLELHQQGNRWNVPFSRELIEKKSKHVLVLKPL